MKRRAPLSPAEERRKRSWAAHHVLVRLGFTPTSWEAPGSIFVDQAHDVEPAFVVTHAAEDDERRVLLTDLRAAIAQLRAIHRETKR